MPKKIDILRDDANEKDKAKRERVFKAAQTCFERYGPQKTTMADIAKEAGISRETLYRAFDDRAALIEYVLQQRMITMREKIRKKLSTLKDFEEAVIEGVIYSLTLAKADKLFNEIVKFDTNHRVEQFLFRGTDEILTDMIRTWSPVIALGREAGRVREDFTDERVVEILMGISMLILIRDDYDKAEQSALLTDVFLACLRPN